MAKNESDILIIGPSWVGDMVMAQVLFKVLKRRYPNSHIDVMAPDWSAPILSRMAQVREHVSMPIGHGTLALRKRRALAKSLKDKHYKKSFVLPNSFKSALIPYWASIPERVGFKGEMRYGLLNDLRPLDKAQFPLMIQRFAYLGFNKQEQLPSELPKPELQIDSAKLQQVVEQKHLRTDKPILALCPGAEFGPSKQWPLEYYIQTAQYFIQRGVDVWIFGSKNDSNTAQAINHACQNQAVDLAGKTTLSEACDLLSLADAVVTNDSGLMHIAAALDKPLVAFYGSTDPSFTPPLASKKFIYQTKEPCSPCFKRTCPLGHHRCMKSLVSEPVIKTLESWLS